MAGNPTAFGVLFDRHARAVYNHCFRLTASWAAAEDHTQNAFLLAWRKRAEVRLQRDSALPWLLAVATNVVRSDRRAVRRRLRLAERAPATAPAADHADDVAARIDAERQATDLLAMVGKLPRAEREALALCVWSEISYADAAAVLGIAEVSVRSRVSRARARLAGLLAVPVDAPPAGGRPAGPAPTEPSVMTAIPFPTRPVAPPAPPTPVTRPRVATELMEY